MKLSIEQANKLLEQLTAGVTVVADEQQADKDSDLDAVFNNISDVVGKAIRPELEQEMKSSLESAFTGRYLGALRSAAQRVFNVPKRDMEELSIEQVLAKCKGEVDSRYTQTDAERQTIWEKTVQDYETQLEQQKSDYEQQLSVERSKYAERDITARCISIVEKMPRKGGDLQEQAELLRYKMQKVYEVHYNEDSKKLEFYKEGQPAVNDANEPISDEDFARSWAERTGILVKDTRHVVPADVQAGHRPTTIPLVPEQKSSDSMTAIEAWTDS